MYYDSLWQTFPKMVAATTTKNGEGNLSYRLGNNAGEVTAARQRAATLLNLNPETVVAAQQVHGTHFHHVTAADAGRGALTFETAIPATDGLITSLPNQPLLILTADCCAISVYDPVNQVIALCHAGWRGAVAGLVPDLARELETHYQSQTTDLIISISPAIQQNCYQVGSEVRQQFIAEIGTWTEAFFTQTSADKTQDRYHLDLPGLIKEQWLAAGVEPDHISVSAACTACDSDSWYSYRREHGASGHQGTYLMLRADS